eukprot:192486-Alexandrium_andersonii.AAC.1
MYYSNDYHPQVTDVRAPRGRWRDGPPQPRAAPETSSASGKKDGGSVVVVGDEADTSASTKTVDQEMDKVRSDLRALEQLPEALAAELN